MTRIKPWSFGRAAYNTALNLSPSHYSVWKASVRLADILSQIDGCHEEAALYFQEALDRLPFINGNADELYMYHRIIEMNLASFYLQSRQFSMFFQHYGQWAKLAAESSKTAQGARRILDLYYGYVRLARSSSLTADSSFNWQMAGSDTAWQYIKVYLGQAYDSTMRYMHFVLLSSLEALHGVGYLLKLPFRLFTSTVQIVFVLPAVLLPSLCVIYVASVLVFSFHYFLYVAIVKHKLWMPKYLPAPTILRAIPFTIFCIRITVFILLLSMVYFISFFARRSHFFLTKWYHNVSMDIYDDAIYR